MKPMRIGIRNVPFPVHKNEMPTMYLLSFLKYRLSLKLFNRIFARELRFRSYSVEIKKP